MLGGIAYAQCDCVGDSNGNNRVEVHELVQAVQNALDGCPVPATPTPTLTHTQPTRTFTRTVTPDGESLAISSG